MTITVNALFFAIYRDILGLESMKVTLGHGSTVADLLLDLRGRGEPFTKLPSRPAVAVNLAYSGPDAPLADGDEVAFIPPVAGG